jgi:hypothetical protein
MAELARDINPVDIIDWLYVKEVTDLTSDILRYRRAKAALLEDRFKKKLIECLENLIEKGSHPDSDYEQIDGEGEDTNSVDTNGTDAEAGINTDIEEDAADLEAGDADVEENDAESIANRWFTSARARRELSAWLKRNGVDIDAMYAEALQQAVAELEPIERLQASAELRRNQALHQIERRRNALGLALRQASDRIIENDEPLAPLPAK